MSESSIWSDGALSSTEQTQVSVHQQGTETSWDFPETQTHNTYTLTHKRLNS